MSDIKPKRWRRVCAYCDGRRWVDDEGWEPEYPEIWPPQEREPRNGLIPCGGCNFAGWNTPLAPPRADDRRTS